MVPVAIRYVFRDAPGPAVVLHLGEPLEPGRPDLVPALEGHVISGLERIDEVLRAGELGGAPLVGPITASDWPTRWLAWAWRRVFGPEVVRERV